MKTRTLDFSCFGCFHRKNQQLVQYITEVSGFDVEASIKGFLLLLLFGDVCKHIVRVDAHKSTTV